MSSQVNKISLAQLIDELEHCGADVDLATIAERLSATELSTEELLPYIQPQTESYRRVSVARREHFEVLVLTWLPGQYSVPHDHAGAICAMRVVQGVAREAQYRLTADGYVRLWDEQELAVSQVRAGHDAAVHSLGNSATASEVLVTLHVYAPPLSEFPHYAVLPQPREQIGNENSETLDSRDSRAERTQVVIVGGGFSGLQTAAQLVRQASREQRALDVVIIEKRGVLGEGVAYSTQDDSHLLNVAAERMSAWPEEPQDFWIWANSRYGPVPPGAFLPRRWYGEYLREGLRKAVAECHPGVQLTVVKDEVRGFTRTTGGDWLVHLARAGTQKADVVVLAVGHRPPDDPLLDLWQGSRQRYLVDPWRPLSLGVVNPADSVLILGSGLTAVDTVLSLYSPQRTGSVTLLSRRGLLPQVHAVPPAPPVDLEAWISQQIHAVPRISLATLSRRLRRLTKAHQEQGGDWRSIVDGLRPHLSRIWNSFDSQQRQDFLRRLRPFWEVHRHRMAPEIAQKFIQAQSRGWLRQRVGRVSRVNVVNDEIQVEWRGTDRAPTTPMTVEWVINCTGPGPSNTAVSNPAIGSLLRAGWVRPDPLALGLDIDETGRVFTRSNERLDNLLVLGTLRKPQLWESTAVPELRHQAAGIARYILAWSRGRHPSQNH